ncbi:MAG: hypothetical protein ACSHX8_13045 [Opitutaceae bacterium]
MVSKVRVVLSFILLMLLYSASAGRFIADQVPADSVYGYVYLKVTQTEGDEVQSIRYVASLPIMRSGQRVQKDLVFHLEPIFTSDQRAKIIPKLGDSFVLDFTTTPNVEDDMVSFIMEMGSATLPHIDTEFSTRGMDLLRLANVEILCDEVTTQVEWQCRIFGGFKDISDSIDIEAVHAFLDELPEPEQGSDSAALKRLFESSGIDFANHPRSRIIADCRQILFRLPPREMAMVKLILAQYSEVKQNYTTVRARYESYQGTVEASVGILGLSGKRIDITGIYPHLFGYSLENSDQAGFEFSVTSNADSNSEIAVIAEWNANNILGGHAIRLNSELSMYSGNTLLVASRTQELGDEKQQWEFFISAIEYSNPDILIEYLDTDFIPISRRAVRVISDGIFLNAPVDPFAAPTEKVEKHGRVLELSDFYRNETEVPETEGASFGFDGEQIIIRDRPEVIRHVKDAVKQLDYEAPVVGGYSLTYENSRGAAVIESVSLSALSGKLGSFSMKYYSTDSIGGKIVSGIDFSVSPYASWSDIELDLRQVRGGNGEFSLMPEASADWWTSNIERTDSGQKIKQHLPPISESEWSFELFEIADEQSP